MDGWMDYIRFNGAFEKYCIINGTKKLSRYAYRILHCTQARLQLT